MKRILITIAAALALVPTLGAQESTWKNTEPQLKPEVFELLNLITATARASAHRK